MEQLKNVIREELNRNLNQIIISNQRKKDAVKKVKIRPVLIKDELYFQASETVDKKEIHTNYTAEQLLQKIDIWLRDQFKQLELTSATRTIHALVSKKGKATIKVKNECNKRKQPLEHNRKKEYIIESGKPIDFLVDLGVMTKEGKIVHAKYDKFKQINRFLEFIEDILPHLPKDREVTIIDFGCGKSYLTFAMYHYLKVMKEYDIRIIGLDLKEDVIAYCNQLKERYGYEKLNFYQGNIESFEGVSHVDMVVTLHACDTATDYAIDKAVRWGASVILSVPCCQHELNGQMHSEMLEPIMQYGLLRERFCAIATDGLRAQLLEMAGYRTQILEFIDMEHTPKNLLIRAVKTGKKAHNRAEYERLRDFLSVEPTLERLWKDGTIL
ncbi:MAG: SAM-dependent methyltransferase [Clostridiales bacterium]|nr:SAM-dependent methyltransferase [Clostridiales bacterium]